MLTETTMDRPAMQAAPLLKVRGLEAWYDESELLPGIGFEGG